MEMIIKKTGKDIVLALTKQEEKIITKLDRYNKKLEEFLENRNHVKSFLIRWKQGSRGYYDRGKLFGKDDLSSEKIEEIGKIISKTSSLQEELYRIRIICKHIDENEEFSLEFRELSYYGFDNK